MAKKIFYSLLSLILAGLVVFAGLFFGVPEINAKIKEAIIGETINTPNDPEDPGNTGENPNNPDDGNIITGADGNAVISGSESSGIDLMNAKLPRKAYAANGVSAQADTAFVFTANITPSYADNQLITYSIAWKNPTSAWANGKNVSDYFTITQATDGAKSATLTCLQGFGEQAILTAESRSNSKAKATATVDYRKKVELSTYTIANQLTLNGNTSSVKTWTWASYDGENTNSWFKYGNYNETYSIGTLDDEVTQRTVTVEVSAELKSKLSTSFPSSYDSKFYNSTLTVKGKISQGELFGYAPRGSATGELGLFDFVTDDYDYEDRQITSSFGKLATCMKAASVDFVITVETTTNSGRVVRATYNVNVDDSSLEIIVNSVSLDNSGVIF